MRERRPVNQVGRGFNGVAVSWQDIELNKEMVLYQASIGAELGDGWEVFGQESLGGSWIQSRDDAFKGWVQSSQDIIRAAELGNERAQRMRAVKERREIDDKMIADIQADGSLE